VDHGGNGHDRNGCLVLQTYIFFDHSLMPRLPYIIESVKGAALTSFSESSNTLIPIPRALPLNAKKLSRQILVAQATAKPPHINHNFPTAVLQYCNTYARHTALSPPHFGTGKKLKEQRGPNPKSRAGWISCCFCSVKPTKLRHRFILEN